jgi:hypothetical protein
MAGPAATLRHQKLGADVAPASHEPAVERIFQLLRRHPHISSSEASEIVRFLRQGRYRQVHQLAADKSVRRQLDEFVKDRRQELNDFAHPLTAIGLILLFLAALWGIWQPLG